MSRATDAFSSLISNVPGVDTSCFVKRTLNDLKPKDRTPPPTPSVQSQQPVVEDKQPKSVDFSFASADLDALGKPATPQRNASPAVVFEDLFEHIPGLEDPITAEATTDFQQDMTVDTGGRIQDEEHDPMGLTDGLSPQQLQPQATLESYQSPSAETHSGGFQFDIHDQSEEPTEFEKTDGRRDDVENENLHKETEASQPYYAVSTQPVFHHSTATETSVTSPYPSFYPVDGPMTDGDIGMGYDIPQTSNTKTSELKATLEKYRTTLNKKAVSLKKKGLKAMRQGFDAAQEWMDKCIEDRKQHRQTSSQKKDDAKRIEMFLMEMEQLSHHRREQLMAELPAEFFQKVIDYAEDKGLTVEHLFVTGRENLNADDWEPVSEHDWEPVEEEETTEEHQSEVTSDFQSQGACLDVTGDEEPCHSSDEDCDLLGLSSDRTNDVHPQTSQRPSQQEMELVDPNDFDAFFAAGEATVDVNPDVLSEVADFDLMKFDDGHQSESTCDFSDMYHRLKQGGRHSESEIRAILKQKRDREKQNKMAAALQAKVDRERESEAEQEELHRLKEMHVQKISEWKEQHAGNMRGLLTTLQSVLWENSGWVALTIGDVLEVTQVKKAYMKANLIIHPDKVKQKGGTAEQVVVADMVFNVLKEAWQSFQM